MLHSLNFQNTTIVINGQQYPMEYELKEMMPKSYAGFGNIYVNQDEPFEFTFFTVNDKIGGYTPMNATRDLISNIVLTVTGVNYPFED